MDAQAQGNLVTGAVRDAKGEPVIGATVIVKGTATGATSGADGRYSIQAGPDATLEFSRQDYIAAGSRFVPSCIVPSIKSDAGTTLHAPTAHRADSICCRFRRVWCI